MGDVADLDAVRARLDRWRSRSRKTCQACTERLPLSSFGPDARKRDGLRSTCRACEAHAARLRWHVQRGDLR